MTQQKRSQLFDDWAEYYDREIQTDTFPFDGYNHVLDEVSNTVCAESSMSLLDLGIGTGNLAGRFTHIGCEIWGIDFSEGMLERAHEKLPAVKLIHAGLFDRWPGELNRQFDRIVSGYVLHEFDLDMKVRLLQRLSRHHLAQGGFIVIGDIAFPTTNEREKAQKRWPDTWDDEEHYWAADEAKEVFECAGLNVTYKQISMCGGVLVVRPGIYK